MVHDPQLRWIIFEGLIPLFGASFMFALWGGMKRVTHDGSSPFHFAWEESIDSLGWLYGALIIAVQSAMKIWAAIDSEPAIGWGCIFAGVVCLMLLLSAMDQRGRNAAWRPPRSTKLISVLLAGATLFAGYKAQAVPVTEAKAVTMSDNKAGPSKQ